MLMGYVVEAEWGVVQRDGCGRRKDARAKGCLSVAQNGRAISWNADGRSPLLRQHVLRFGICPPGGACLNTVRFPTVQATAGTCPFAEDTVTTEAFLPHILLNAISLMYRALRKRSRLAESLISRHRSDLPSC